MSGDKPYNPYGLSEKELKADEEATLKKRDEQLANARTRQAVEPQPSLKALVKEKKFRTGIPVHHGARKPHGESSGKPDKGDVDSGAEIGIKELNRKISDLLKRYKLENSLKFRVLGSNKTKGSYEFKLLENYTTILDFEDKPENIVTHLEKYLKNR